MVIYSKFEFEFQFIQNFNFVFQKHKVQIQIFSPCRYKEVNYYSVPENSFLLKHPEIG